MCVFYRHPCCELLASGMAMGVNPERVFVGISTLSMQMVRTNAFLCPVGHLVQRYKKIFYYAKKI